MAEPVRLTDFSLTFQLPNAQGTRLVVQTIEGKIHACAEWGEGQDYNCREPLLLEEVFLMSAAESMVEWVTLWLEDQAREARRLRAEREGGGQGTEVRTGAG